MSNPDIVIVITTPQTMVVTIHEGLAGPPLVDVNTYTTPVSITNTLTTTADQRARIFIQGNTPLSVVTSMSNGTGTQELYLFGASTTNRVLFTQLSNLFLSGMWESKIGSILYLIWTPNLNQWVEVSRNDI